MLPLFGRHSRATLVLNLDARCGCVNPPLTPALAGLDEPCRLCLSVAYGGSPGMAVLARQDVCEPRMVCWCFQETRLTQLYPWLASGLQLMMIWRALHGPGFTLHPA